MKKLKELHLVMNITDAICMDEVVEISYETTLYKILCTDKDILYTTQPLFLSFKYAERLFVIVNNIEHEITIGECDGINKIIKSNDNIVYLLLSGRFDWYNLSNCCCSK